LTVIGPEAPTDANIAAYLLAASNTDVSYARIAATRAHHQAVKEFAARMLTDHAASDGLVRDLDTRVNIEPRDNAQSLHFRDESTAERSALRSVTASAFDATYIANEIAFHTQLINAMDTLLQPNALNPSLKQLIASLRPTFAEHLAHAERVQAELNRGA
jgi:putative membrane protein